MVQEERDMSKNFVYTTKVEDNASDLHDPNGPDFQVHDREDSGDLIVTFSDKITQELGWRLGDSIEWRWDGEKMTIVNVSKEARAAAEISDGIA